MSKKTIVIVFLIGVLFLLGTVAAGLALSHSTGDFDRYRQEYGNAPGIGDDQTYLELLNQSLDMYFLALALGTGTFVFGCIAWIGTLVRQGKQGQWGWFFGTLIFSGITLLIYLLVVPETQRLPAPFSEPDPPLTS